MVRLPCTLTSPATMVMHASAQPHLLEELVVVCLADILGGAGPQGLVVILHTPVPHILIVCLHDRLNLHTTHQHTSSSTRSSQHTGARGYHERP
jgi:hypothetical protein